MNVRLLTSNSAQARFTDSARQRSASNDCSSCRRTMWPQCWIRSSGCWTNSWATGGRSVRSCCRRWRAVRRRADNTPQSSSKLKTTYEESVEQSEALRRENKALQGNADTSVTVMSLWISVYFKPFVKMHVWRPVKTWQNSYKHRLQ